MSIIQSILAKKETREYFLLLAVETHRIRAAICQILANQVVIKGSGDAEFIAGENEVEAADIAISMAEKKLPEGILVEKVIFALPQTFLDQDKIKSEHLDRLKKVSKELSLTPGGFIEYPASISFHLEKEEGSPPTLLLIHITSNQLVFSLLRVGKIQQNIIIPRTSEICADFEASFASFATEILPSRIILYDECGGEKLEELKEELLRFPWNRHSIFLHTPKIEILSAEKVILALIDAAASSFLKSISLQETATPKEMDSAITKKAEEYASETFGFVKTTELATKKSKLADEGDNIQKPTPSTAIKKPLFRLPKLSFPFISLSFSSLFKSFFLPAAILSLLFVLVGLAFWFYPKTSVYLIIYPQTNSEKISLTFTAQEKNITPDKNIVLTIPIT